MASNSDAEVPVPPEDAFTEDFPFSPPNQVNADPWSPLPRSENDEKKADFLELTSERYIASLEARLNRIKGKSKDPTSKDLIIGLTKAKDAHMTELVQSSDQPYLSNYIPEKVTVQNQNKLLQGLHPEKIAISSDERKLLVEDDDLSKRKVDSSVAENSTASDSVSRTLDPGSEKTNQQQDSIHQSQGSPTEASNCEISEPHEA